MPNNPTDDLPPANQPRFEFPAGSAGAPRRVSLQRSENVPTVDQPLWVAIRSRTDAIGFNPYKAFVDRILCPKGGNDPLTKDENSLRSKLLAHRNTFDHGHYGIDSYNVLRAATEAFLVLQCGVTADAQGIEQLQLLQNVNLTEERARLDQPTLTKRDIEDELAKYLTDKSLPYLHRVVDAAFSDEIPIQNPWCHGILEHRIHCPLLLELIWSYWHEEGMLVQSINAITMRFQNRRLHEGREPLARLELDPLRPLNNILWGYIQEEYRRLSVPRRAYEYDHHYGLRIYGKAVPGLQPADSRSKFVEAFHNLLYLCHRFYQEDNDTTVISDAFPVLNSLKEVHLLLAEGAHNQFGDLPWTARVEMLVQQWMLARPEMRDFLAGRYMVPYEEPWMGQVDTMKTLQGWTDISVTHFRHLAVFGEQILLSIRYGDWVGTNDQMLAKNWARYWRPEIQGYIHAYRSVTGVDLTADISEEAMAVTRYTQPSVLLQNRLRLQQRDRERLSATSPSSATVTIQAPPKKLIS